MVFNNYENQEGTKTYCMLPFEKSPSNTQHFFGQNQVIVLRMVCPGMFKKYILLCNNFEKVLVHYVS